MVLMVVTGESYFQGFLGGAKWISSTHSKALNYPPSLCPALGMSGLGIRLPGATRTPSDPSASVWEQQMEILAQHLSSPLAVQGLLYLSERLAIEARAVATKANQHAMAFLFAQVAVPIFNYCPKRLTFNLWVPRGQMRTHSHFLPGTSRE